MFFTAAVMKGRLVTQSILEIFKQSGDDHLGQTLVRLARLAESRHQFEQASTITTQSSIQPLIQREDRFVAQGGAQTADGLLSGSARKTVHTEVDR